MKFKVFLFAFIIMFSSVFTFGDAFIIQVKNELISNASQGHHHLDRESHEAEHKKEEHSKNCEDECHFCLFSGATISFITELPNVIIGLNRVVSLKNNYYYAKLYSDTYLEGIWQPPRVIG